MQNILKIKSNIIIEIFISTLIVLFLGFYVFQINNTIVSYISQTQNYQRKIEELIKENKILEINLTQKESLKNFEEKIKDLNFEKTNKIYYIQILENQVANR